MKGARIFGLAVAATLVAMAPGAGALQSGCVDPDLSGFPIETRIEYDLSECTLAAIDGNDDGLSPPIVREVGDALLIIVGVQVGEGGVCLIADPSTAGSIFLDLDDHCAEDPCDKLEPIVGPLQIGDPCEIAPVTSTGSTRAIGSAPGQGASL